MRNLFLLSFLLLSVLGISYAQLGEVAGPLDFNVSIGSSQTQQLILINEGDTPIEINVTLNSINYINHTMTPVFSFNPQTATINPHSQLPINVTVYMPYNTSNIGKHWEAIISAAETSGTQISGTGAIVVAGVAKIANVTGAPPKPLPIIYYVVGGAVGAAIVASGIYLGIYRRRKKAERRRVLAKKVKKEIAKKAKRKAKKSKKAKKRARRSKK